MKIEIFLKFWLIRKSFEKWSVLFILHATFAGFFHSRLQFFFIEEVRLKTVQFDSKTPDEAERVLMIYPANLELQVKMSFWL